MTNFYPWSRDKLIIGKFCQIAAGVEFVMNDANHQMNAVSTFPFYTLEGWNMDAPSAGRAVWFKYNIVVNELYGKILCYSICGIIFDKVDEFILEKRQEEDIMLTQYDYIPNMKYICDTVRLEHKFLQCIVSGPLSEEEKTSFLRHLVEDCSRNTTVEVLQRLQERGIQMYRTDLHGKVVLYSDGSSIWSDQEPLPCAVREELADAVRARLQSQDWTPGIAEGQTRTMPVDDGTGQEDSSGSGESSEEPLYVCNTNTKKFHYPSCDSVKQMNESNRMNTNLSRVKAPHGVSLAVFCSFRV